MWPHEVIGARRLPIAGAMDGVSPTQPCGDGMCLLPVATMVSADGDGLLGVHMEHNANWREAKAHAQTNSHRRSADEARGSEVADDSECTQRQSMRA